MKTNYKLSEVQMLSKNLPYPINNPVSFSGKSSNVKIFFQEKRQKDKDSNPSLTKSGNSGSKKSIESGFKQFRIVKRNRQSSNSSAFSIASILEKHRSINLDLEIEEGGIFPFDKYSKEKCLLMKTFKIPNKKQNQSEIRYLSLKGDRSVTRIPAMSKTPAVPPNKLRSLFSSNLPLTKDDNEEIELSKKRLLKERKKLVRKKQRKQTFISFGDYCDLMDINSSTNQIN